MRFQATVTVDIDFVNETARLYMEHLAAELRVAAQNLMLRSIRSTMVDDVVVTQLDLPAAPPAADWPESAK